MARPRRMDIGKIKLLSGQGCASLKLVFPESLQALKRPTQQKILTSEFASTRLLTLPKLHPNRYCAGRGAHMITAFVDPFDALFNLQRELEVRLASDWLQDPDDQPWTLPPQSTCSSRVMKYWPSSSCPTSRKRPANPSQGEHHPHLWQEIGRVPRAGERAPKGKGVRRVRSHPDLASPPRSGPRQS
jgi:hypothetical protein